MLMNARFQILVILVEPVLIPMEAILANVQSLNMVQIVNLSTTLKINYLKNKSFQLLQYGFAHQEFMRLMFHYGDVEDQQQFQY